MYFLQSIFCRNIIWLLENNALNVAHYWKVHFENHFILEHHALIHHCVKEILFSAKCWSNLSLKSLQNEWNRKRITTFLKFSTCFLGFFCLGFPEVIHCYYSGDEIHDAFITENLCETGRCYNVKITQC